MVYNATASGSGTNFEVLPDVIIKLVRAESYPFLKRSNI